MYILLTGLNWNVGWTTWAAATDVYYCHVWCDIKWFVVEQVRERWEILCIRVITGFGHGHSSMV